MDAIRNPVLEAIRTRRSVRKYTDRPLGREHLQAILEAGRWAPSGLNNQPWRFLALLPGDPRLTPLSACTKYAPFIRNAAAVICVFLERAAMYNPTKDHQGAGACIQSMLLAAHSLGLGAVWLGEIINQEPRPTQALGLPAERYELQAVLTLGWPAHPGASSRKPLEELLLEPLPAAGEEEQS